jgi:hypothetical protein
MKLAAIAIGFVRARDIQGNGHCECQAYLVAGALDVDRPVYDVLQSLAKLGRAAE